MSFVNPYFLWALSSLSIPILIHLFNFRKTTKIFFSNTKLIKQVQQQTSQKRKIKQYLVLASRLLFLFFLVMAFAQPFLAPQEEKGAQKNIAIYIDNSLSMSVPVAEKTRALDEAIRMGQTIVDLFPVETHYQLITNDFAAASTVLKTKTEVTDLLSQIRSSSISRSADEIKRKVMGKEVTLFWISDFQKSTFGKTKVDSTWQVRLAPLALEEHGNVYVDSVYFENPFAIGGEKNSLRVLLKNSSSKNIEGLLVKFSINNIQAGATSIAIEPNSAAQVKFDIASKLHGFNKGAISISDFPVSFDNEFLFTLNFSPKIKVIEIRDRNTSPFVEKVFGNKEIFSFQNYAPSNVNYSLLHAADLVVINGVDKIDEALVEALLTYKNRSGSLLIIPGSQTNAGSYQKLISLRLVEPPGKESTELNAPDLQNPFYKNIFADRNTALSMPHATQAIDWGNDRSALLQFKNGKPFLSQVEKTFLMACPLEKKYTDFFNHALFVPIMYRIAASGKKSERPLYYSLSTSVVSISGDSLKGEELARLVGSQEIIPSQRSINGQLIMELPKYALSAGFYKVINHADTLGLLAFNLDKNESLLNQLKPEEAKSLLGGKNSISIFRATDAESFDKEIKAKYLGKPLWKYAVMLSLIFLLAEVLLIRFLK